MLCGMELGLAGGERGCIELTTMTGSFFGDTSPNYGEYQ